jgi:rod shape determining protein RodA
VLILMQPNLGTATLVTASGVFACCWPDRTGAGDRRGGLAVAAPLAWFGLRQYEGSR